MSAAWAGYRASSALGRSSRTTLGRIYKSKGVLHTCIRQTTRPYSAASTAIVTPTTPSFLRRTINLLAIGISCTVLGFAMSAAPALPALNGFLTPPTDEETLAMFTPTHPQEIEVETHIGSHWFTQQMRSQPGFTELRPHMKIPEPFRINNFTAGTLRGPGRVPVPPIAFVEDGGKSIVSITYLGEGLCGHPGIVHGGFLATMLDEGMARCSFGVLPHGVGMTASLNINYRAPAMTGSYVVLRAKMTKVEGRKAEVMGRIETLPENEGDTPVVLAEATGLFVSPKQAAMMRSVYPVQ